MNEIEATAFPAPLLGAYLFHRVQEDIGDGQLRTYRSGRWTMNRHGQICLQIWYWEHPSCSKAPLSGWLAWSGWWVLQLAEEEHIDLSQRFVAPPVSGLTREDL